MQQWAWVIPVLAVLLVLQWRPSQSQINSDLAKRVQDLEIKLRRIQEHLGFVVPAGPTTEDVKMLALAGSKIAAIRLYRQQTGAGLKDAKDAVERMMQS